MHFTCRISQSFLFRTFVRHSSSESKTLPFVKVLSTEEDESVKVSFKYCNSPYLNLKAPKSQSVQNVLSRIKLMAIYQQKKEEIRRSVEKDFLETTSDDTINNINSYIDVALIQNDEPIDINLPNCDAWNLASSLKIGDTMYEVKFNVPSVVTLSLPDCILAGCAIRPHFIFECTSIEDSKFVWYRSITPETATKLIEEGKENEVQVEDEECWLKVGEEFVYFTSMDDIDHFLKVVCTPVQNGRTGLEYSIQSKYAVEMGPTFPFEERQMHTKSFCDDSR